MFEVPPRDIFAYDNIIRVGLSNGCADLDTTRHRDLS